MSDLLAFLEARLDEDERIANEARHELTGEWRQGTDPSEDVAGEVYSEEKIFNADTNQVVVYDEGAPTLEEAQHIARYDPARVLREVATKRALLNFAFIHTETIDGEWGCCHSGDQIRAGECPDNSPSTILELKLLAAPYSDHPDYEAAWAFGG